MWNLFGRLAATIWMLRAPVAICALIFGGMAVINEIGSWHQRQAAAHAAEKGCDGASDESGKPAAC